MIEPENLKYLINDIISLRMSENHAIDFKINETSFFIITHNTIGYEEPLFSFSNPQVTEYELNLLKEISPKKRDYLIDQNQAVIRLSESGIPLFKILHFMVNEYWIDNQINFDEHGRLTSNSIKETWLFSQEIPLSELIIKSILFTLNIPANELKTLHFTCDYDVLEMWKSMSLRQKVTRIAAPLKNGDIISFWQELKYFISEKMQYGSNPLLNNTMFIPSQKKGESIEIRNTAFWHIHQSHMFYDPFNDFKSPSIIHFLKDLTKMGIEHALHPCYGSSGDKLLMSKQVEKFEQIFSANPTKARYHYLKCLLPDDLIILHSNGIKEDYSYCFPDKLLFRGGRSGPVKMIDKRNLRAIPVLSYPLSIMESTLSDYMKLNLHDAQSVANEHIDIALNSGGYCGLLWHNRSMFKNDHPNNYHPELFNAIVDKLRSKKIIS